MVCGFFEPIVFTKTVWTKCSAVCTGQAAVRKSCMVRLLFCSRNGKLNRCRKLYRCRQLNQNISELFSMADQCLFLSLQKNSHHVLHHLLPAKSTQPYNRGINLVGNLGDGDRLLSGPNFLLVKLAVLKHMTHRRQE